MKLKVGTRVKIKSLEWYAARKDNLFEAVFESDDRSSICFNSLMTQYCRMEAIITEITNDGFYHINLDSGHQLWDNWMFELDLRFRRPRKDEI